MFLTLTIHNQKVQNLLSRLNRLLNDPPASSNISSETKENDQTAKFVTCYEQRAHIHIVTFNGTESNASLLVVPVLLFLFWALLLITGPCQYFFRSWGGCDLSLFTKYSFYSYDEGLPASEHRSRQKVLCEGSIMICWCSVNTLQPEQCLNDRWT